MKKKRLLQVIVIAFVLAMLTGCGKNGTEKTATPTPTEYVKPTHTPTSTPTNTPTPTNTSTPTPTPTTSITIGMVGDVLLHTRIEKDCKQADGTYDYNSIFSHTKELISAFDLAMANQEVIIGGAELGISAYPTFNADFALADALRNAGFDVALHATNHALDKGKKGIINCLNNWKNYPEISVLGIYGSKEEAENQIYYYEKDGVKIAILNFTYSTNGIAIPTDMDYCVGPLLTDKNKDKIATLLDTAKANSDFLVVAPHWGDEYTIKEVDKQKNWNAFFYQHGVDLVIGTHPHVVEPIAVTDSEGTKNLSEYPVDENGHRCVEKGKMLTFYSIGNFVNWTGESGSKIYQRMLGGVSSVVLSKDEEGQVFILDFDITPVVSHVVTGQNQVTVYKFSEYTEELAKVNEIKSQTDNFSIDKLTKLCDEVWGELWRR